MTTVESTKQNSFEAKFYWGKVTTLTLFSLLCISFVVWQAMRDGGWSWILLFFQLVPIFLFLPLMLKNNPRAYIGLCFVLLLYFIKGVEGMFHPAATWIDTSTVALSVALFISSMMTSRWLQFARN